MKNRIIRDYDLTLIPGTLEDNSEYLLHLAGMDKYDITPRHQLLKGLENLRYLWTARTGISAAGIALMCQLEMGWWTLDLYEDKRIATACENFIVRAGRMVIDWFFKNHPYVDEVHMMVRTHDKEKIKSCYRVGFVPKYDNSQWTIFHIEKEKANVNRIVG